MEKSFTTAFVCNTFGPVMGAFFTESISHMLPWLLVSFAVVLCDLIVGLRKSMILDEEIRFSSAVRRTMGKLLTYFSFCVMVAMIDVAAHGGGTIDKWACLLVCFIEFTSIISNLLRPKGYDVNLIKMLAIYINKSTGISKESIEESIEEVEGKKE
jgi:hypothetical protein